jgi:hypothetical protein
MHFHVMRVFVIGIILYLFFEYDVMDFAAKKYDEIHAKAVHDMHAIQMQYQHHY